MRPLDVLPNSAHADLAYKAGCNSEPFRQLDVRFARCSNRENVLIRESCAAILHSLPSRQVDEAGTYRMGDLFGATDPLQIAKRIIRLHPIAVVDLHPRRKAEKGLGNKAVDGHMPFTRSVVKDDLVVSVPINKGLERLSEAMPWHARARSYTPHSTLIADLVNLLKADDRKPSV